MSKSVESAHVYWVGHSLMETKAQSKIGTIDLLTLLGQFADARQLGYDYADHTLWGSSLSTLWRGKAHRYPRTSEEMKVKRQEFQQQAERYDTLILTELLPIVWNSQAEFTAFYLRKFACTLLKQNPEARVLLYQSWTNLQPSADGNPPQHQTDHTVWLSNMAQDRAIWQSVRKLAAQPRVPAPTLLSRIGIHASSNGGCDKHLTIEMVPVGDVLVSLTQTLSKSAPDAFLLPSGRQMQIEDFFSNPYLNVREPPLGHPASSPEPGRMPGWQLRDPAKPFDDIHPSAIGIYIMTLVSFAAIYGQSPEGLPSIPEVGDDLAQQLQQLVWQTLMDN